MDEGGKRHIAFSVEIGRYTDDCHLYGGYVCKECADKNCNLTTKELFNLMLDPAVAKYPKNNADDFFLAMMVDLGNITNQQVCQARAEAKSGQSVTDVLLGLKLVTPAYLATAKAAHFGTDVVVIRDTMISSMVVGLIKPYHAWRYRIMPIEKRETHVVFAVEDPADVGTFDSLAHLLSTDIVIQVAASDDMEAALKKYYPDGEVAGKSLREEDLEDNE
ncbi:MAG: hypothetical protein WCQ60_00875 [bacterium]